MLDLQFVKLHCVDPGNVSFGSRPKRQHLLSIMLMTNEPERKLSTSDARIAISHPSLAAFSITGSAASPRSLFPGFGTSKGFGASRLRAAGLGL